MYGTITIGGDRLTEVNPDNDITDLDDGLRVQVETEAADGITRCRYCGEDIWQERDETSQYGESWVASMLEGGGVCETNAEPEEVDPYIQRGSHAPSPMSWCNSAALTFDSEDDAVHVSISVGDPRGAFVMTVRRLADGTLILHHPYPGEGLAHAETTELSMGTLEIGS